MSTSDLLVTEFLLSPEGDRAIELAKSLQGSFLTRVTALRKHYPPEIAGAVLDLLELRERAARKFPRADRMFFTREALEQSSGETISTYRAKRYAEGSRVLDLACGIGGDTIGLAQRCFVTAVDRDPVRILMAERNIEVYGLSDRVTFICDDVTRIPLEADAAFLDPSRRDQGRRVVKLSEVSPSIDFIRRLVEAVPNTAIKLSPATDYAELEALDAEIEFISESGECKEASAWFGGFRSAIRRATILPGEHTLAWEQTGHVPVSEPKEYLYEPEPCVIRAHLVEQLASSLNAVKVDEQIAYLTSDQPTTTPFASTFRVVDHLPFNLKHINRRLKELGARRVIVKKRGVPFEPREIERRLKLDGATDYILVLTRVQDKPHALICLPIHG